MTRKKHALRPVAVDQVWAQHREALVAEARAHGFEPHAATHRTPSGPRAQQWRDVFLAAHAY